MNQTQAKLYEGRLTVSEVMSEAPGIVPAGTTLLRVAEILSQRKYRHLLVHEGDGNVVGVVTSSDLLRYMKDRPDEGQGSWKDVPVEAVMSTKFLASSPHADADDLVSVVTRGDIHCVPVLEDGKLVGVLTPNDLLMSWNRLDPVLRMATVDPVTELANRQTFERRLGEEWDRASREGNSLGILLADVDYFKEINDTCGHGTGDAVLHLVANALRRQLRSYDVVARYGGDEFAAICVGCRPEEIDIPVRRVLTSVGELSIPGDRGRRQVSLSVGAAVACDSLADLTPEELIAAADACLYQAKREGRGRGYRTEKHHERPTAAGMTVIMPQQVELLHACRG
jgi:diguanylate cyclase (GGDEF)-like protein